MGLNALGYGNTGTNTLFGNSTTKGTYTNSPTPTSTTGVDTGYTGGTPTNAGGKPTPPTVFQQANPNASIQKMLGQYNQGRY
jgi:hypothetical protein